MCSHSDFPPVIHQNVFREIEPGHVAFPKKDKYEKYLPVARPSYHPHLCGSTQSVISNTP